MPRCHELGGWLVKKIGVVTMRLFVLAFTLFLGISAVGFEVPPGGSECFWEEAKKMSAVTVIYQVTHGGYLDIDVEMFAPDGRPLYSGTKETSGKFSVMAQSDGMYKVCFGNQMSTVTSKIVIMDILVRQPKANPEEKKDKSPDPSIDSLQESLSLLHDTAGEMTVELRYLQNREIAHTNTIASTARRVYNWAMFEIVTLIVMTFLQLFYLRAFFEGKTSSV